MNFNNIKFEQSFGTTEQLPKSTLPEISFAGRSNVGKSSLLNTLFERKNLARVSQRPGKTQTINFFANESARFVDLPGYGYAKVSKTEKARWAKLIEGYFFQKRNFALVVSLVDIRHAAFELDKQMIGFLQELNLPHIVVLTKADKLSKNAVAKQKALLKRELELKKNSQLIVVSSTKRTGFCELREAICLQTCCE